MKLVTTALLAVCCCAPFAAAQLTPEEAQARLAERRAHAATQPAPDELQEYKQIVAELRAENVKLKAQIAALQAELKKRPAATPEPTATADKPKVDPTTAIHNGMTLAEAESAAGHRAVETGGANGERLYTLNMWDGMKHYVWAISVKDGKVISSSYSVSTYVPPAPPMQTYTGRR